MKTRLPIHTRVIERVTRVAVTETIVCTVGQTRIVIYYTTYVRAPCSSNIIHRVYIIIV